MYHLSCGFDAFDHAQKSNDPGEKKAQGKVPHHRTNHVYAGT